LAYDDGFYRWSLADNVIKKMVDSPFSGMHVSRMECSGRQILGFSTLQGDCFVVDHVSGSMLMHKRFGRTLRFATLLDQGSLLLCLAGDPWSVAKYDMLTMQLSTLLTQHDLRPRIRGDVDRNQVRSMLAFPRSSICVAGSRDSLCVVDYASGEVLEKMDNPPRMTLVSSEHGEIVDDASLSTRFAHVLLRQPVPVISERSWGIPSGSFVTSISNVSPCATLAVAYTADTDNDYSNLNTIRLFDRSSHTLGEDCYYSQSRIRRMTVSPDCTSVVVAEWNGMLGVIYFDQ
jgi:hypothetical protein